MIGVLYPYAAREQGALVTAAFARSVTREQVRPIARAHLASVETLVVVDLPDAWGTEVVMWLRGGARKLVIFGRVADHLVEHLQWKPLAWPESLARASRSESAPSYASRESAATVVYGERAALLQAQGWRRPFERFDFTDEWNNLGYGAIRAAEPLWGLSDALDTGWGEIACVEIDGQRVASYAALTDIEHGSVLWFNRSVGPADSFEWRAVERFLSYHRAGELPCHPVLTEVPWGYDAAVTSRLDCDEDVESARPLWDAYRAEKVPFSLAVHTGNLADARNHAILAELAEAGGAVLSHSATHAGNWGGSYEAALHEALESAQRLRQITGKPVRYAVSPFHQSPPYALHALADAGYSGCVGGLIRNDPEFVLARSGALAHMADGFIGHTQQCMLHGFSMLAEGDALAVFKQAFDLAYETSTLFGYLDHPFSPRYAYGWNDEAARIAAHRGLIAHIRAKADNPLFLNEDDALDFLAARAQARVVEENGGFFGVAPRLPAGAPALRLTVEYRGRAMPLETGALQ
ncbi:polysaccharide deacetylase family protein [Paraburkholderia sp. J41]|uniref:polysaccharide deacetylase family protein n=1 Tax=Paraburkholderia sp. J41 TaxID=2805433 RepID=UPI002AC35A9C|nr:polysaccharide deacetylase family protein [Paraburkholderia sp. J41]